MITCDQCNAELKKGDALIECGKVIVTDEDETMLSVGSPGEEVIFRLCLSCFNRQFYEYAHHTQHPHCCDDYLTSRMMRIIKQCDTPSKLKAFINRMYEEGYEDGANSV